MEKPNRAVSLQGEVTRHLLQGCAPCAGSCEGELHIWLCEPAEEYGTEAEHPPRREALDEGFARRQMLHLKGYGSTENLSESTLSHISGVFSFTRYLLRAPLAPAPSGRVGLRSGTDFVHVFRALRECLQDLQEGLSP